MGLVMSAVQARARRFTVFGSSSVSSLLLLVPAAFTATTGSPYNRYLYACPITGCPAAPVTLASRDTRSGTILPIGIVGTNAYWAIKYPFDTYVTDLLGGAWIRVIVEDPPAGEARQR